LITVLAGVNGAGKSSIGGSSLRAAGAEYFNPDEEARALMHRFSGLSQERANERIWHEGVERLRAAITNNTDWTFETTLGGRTISDLLLQASEKGIALKLWYCGLDSPEKHIERVSIRVARGGHDIPEERIRYRYVSSLKNLCRLAPACATLAVYDNSRDIVKTDKPSPRLLIRAAQGRLDHLASDLPRWARPVVGALLPNQAH